MREKAKQGQPKTFRVYSKVRKKLMPQSTFSLERQRQKKRMKGRGG